MEREIKIEVKDHTKYNYKTLHIKIDGVYLNTVTTGNFMALNTVGSQTWELPK